ncbi:MAG: hypothetical protein WD751_11115 [Anaerolineales bacterium]
MSIQLPSSSSKLSGWLRPSAAILLFAVSCATSSTGPSDPRQNLYSALAPVCAGGSSPGSAAYDGSGPHPIVLASIEGEISGWSNHIPENWLPVSAQEAQLVVCLEWQDTILEECEFITGPNITRYRADLLARILEARTGREVASQRFQGANARQCRSSEENETRILYGTRPSYRDIEGWLSEYVEGQAVPAQP